MSEVSEEGNKESQWKNLNAFRHWKLGSRVLCGSKTDPPSTSNRLATLHTLQITYCNVICFFFLYYSGSCTWHLHSFALCTVGCTLGKQNKFTLKIGLDWRIQNWGACSRSQAMTLQTPLPSRMYRRNLLKWPDILFQQYLHVSEFCKLRTSNASEVNKSLSYSYTILQ